MLIETQVIRSKSDFLKELGSGPIKFLADQLAV